MSNLPLIDHLDVQGYGLYPGSIEAPGLETAFPPGVTLVLGTNGIGKSTFVLMLYRLLTGPYDIPGINERTELGFLRLDAKGIQPVDRFAFRARVVDGARDATGTLTFQLGDSEFRLARRLSDLSLLRLEVDGLELPVDEDVFQGAVCEKALVGSFGDWILLLRHLVFYFEERRALVWDATAQRQVLRILLLPSSLAAEWSSRERRILELDSETRGLTFAVSRAGKLLSKSEVLTEGGEAVRARLGELEGEQSIEVDAQAELGAQLLELNSSRQDLRLRLLNADQELDRRYRAVERARMLVLGATFPDESESARLVMAQLLSERECLVCGQSAVDAAEAIAVRLRDGECAVCGNRLASKAPIEHLKREIPALEELYDLALLDRDSSRAALEEVQVEYAAADARARELQRSLAVRAEEIDALIAALPPEEAELHKQRTDLAGLRMRLEGSQEELAALRQEFSDFVDGMRRRMAEYVEPIVQAFAEYAKGFLIEECRLVWAPHRATVGQSGRAMEFPSFELDLTGADFPSLVRRSGPDQVSESQREFIDLSFRMALSQSVLSNSSGTLVIDAPETSLDGVFSRRAARVLARYSEPARGNRLVVTSNLSGADLLGDLLSHARAESEESVAVVDLFEVATPTAAVRQHIDEYRTLRDEVLAQR